MKDIVGLPRPHIVEDFLLELKKQLTEVGDSFTMPKVGKGGIEEMYA